MVQVTGNTMPSSALLQDTSAFIEAVSSQWTQTRLITKISTSLALVAGLSTTAFFVGYQDWKSLGPGGFPDNLKGYCMNLWLIARAARRDTIGLEFYDGLEGKGKSEEWSFLVKGEQGLRKREGKRSRAKGWVVPQRERGIGILDEEVREAYLSAFSALAKKYADTTEWRLSAMEKRGQALFLRSDLSPPSLASQTTGEICHVHTSDLSGHVTLSFADAMEVIQKGWGERHQLSGTKVINPGYTMLYIPRTREEVGDLVRIFEAGILYMMSVSKEEEES